MDERPVTRYAKAPDGVNLAFQVFGEGPLDLVFVSGMAVPIDLLWDESGFVRFANRLGGFSRSVWCDGRGHGASGGDFSDRFVEALGDTDLSAVLDAVGCDRVVLMGTDQAGPVAVRYAVVHPERVAALVLTDTWAHYVREDDCPWGLPRDLLDEYARSAAGLWGTGAAVELTAPSRANDEAFRGWIARSERLGVGIDAVAQAVSSGFRRDVRALLAQVDSPTLVLHREGNRFVRVGAGRYLADQIPGATYRELPGADHLFFVGETDALLDEVEEFLTGRRQAPEGAVVTATILFTDIVASTEQSARMGHRKWTALTDAHDAMIRTQLARYQGREVKTMGDGFLATFDATTRAVRAATDIVTQAKNLGVQLRAGVHTGEVEVRTNDVVGLTVTIAKRICDLSGPGQVLVSETVKLHLVGSNITTTAQGTHTLKGVPERWRLFAATADT